MKTKKHECDDGGLFLVGLFFGAVLGAAVAIGFNVLAVPVHHGNRRGVSVEQWTATRDAWLADRNAWRNGEPFAYHYGPHGERW